LSRTGAFISASRLASADTTFGASPSKDPTAIDNVTGLTYQWYANQLAPAARRASAATTKMRSQVGSLIEFIPVPKRQRRPARESH
jgi:hypothetical protein